MNYLILGGTGLIGNALSKVLIEQGNKVRILSRRPMPDTCNQMVGNVEWLEGEFSDKTILEEALKNIDIIFHLVSTVTPKTSNNDPIYDIKSNLVSSVEMLELLRSHKVKKIIFSSSGGGVYGEPQRLPISESDPVQPLSSYGIVKLAIEHYLYLYYQQYGLDYAVLRISNAYGSFFPELRDFGAVDVFLKKNLKQLPIEIWGDGEIIRDYVFVDDIVEALLLAQDYNGQEKIFNIGSGTGTSLNQLIQHIDKATGFKSSVRYLPARKVDVHANVLDISLARNNLKWAPKIDLSQGIEVLLHSWKQKGYY